MVGLVDHYVCPFRGLRFHIDQDNRKEKCSVEIREGLARVVEFITWILPW